MATLAIQMLMGLGGIILTALFTPKKPDTWGSRLSNINVPPVSPGNEVPRVWGTMKVPAQMIFCSPLIETMHTHQASKKGGGKGSLFGGNQAKTYTFTYSVDIALGVCVGPVYQVNRIWANQKLLWVAPSVAGQHASRFRRRVPVRGDQADRRGGGDARLRRRFGLRLRLEQLHDGGDHAEHAAGCGQLHHVASDRRHLRRRPASGVQRHADPDEGGVIQVIDELYSSLNNQNTYEVADQPLRPDRDLQRRRRPGA